MSPAAAVSCAGKKKNGSALSLSILMRSKREYQYLKSSAVKPLSQSEFHRDDQPALPKSSFSLGLIALALPLRPQHWRHLITQMRCD